MRILDRYILKSIITIFISCIFLFLFLYVVIDILSHLEDILKHKIHYAVLAQYYLWYLPIMFVQISPFACLLSTLYTFSRLNHSNEIIAMRASGLSIFYITKTALVFGAVVSLFVFLVNGRLMPQAMNITQRIKSQMEEGVQKKADKRHEVISNLSMYGLKNRLFFVSKFYTENNNLEGITILEHDENQNLTKKIVARKGIYEDGLWKFYNSITYNFDLNSQIVNEPVYMAEEIMTIPEGPRGFLAQRQKPESMTIAQLDTYIWKLSKSGATNVIRNLKIDLYQKFTSPFTSLIIIMLGIPFSLMMHKRATGLSSIGISIMVGFLYYIADAIFIAIGRGGAVPPIVAASLSHAIALTLSLIMINNLP
ncbi:MAG: LptF/LptG family permease [Candidatus Omnitrophica bacterium]|nr:LptF/LptG family permease [Candidatus Omnitrophota bacterium]